MVDMDLGAARASSSRGKPKYIDHSSFDFLIFSPSVPVCM